MNILAGDKTSHHTSPPTMSMRLTDGTLAASDAGNASVFVPHLEALFNENRIVDWNMLNNLKQRRIIEEINHQIEWHEF